MAAASGQQYGARAEQMAAQRAIPVAAPPAPSTAPPAGATPAGGAVRSGMPAMLAGLGPLPGQVVPLDAPSMRPGEPVTAGLPVGAGAGAEANPFSSVGSTDDVALALRGAYAAYPSPELRAILERIDLDG